MTDFDVIIIGAGIAGASLAAELARDKRILLIEAEAHPGYHATGRSAAFWAESYGGPAVQPLTTASKPFLAAPPDGFTDVPLLHPRGALHIGQVGDAHHADSLIADFSQSNVRIETLGAEAVKSHIANIRDGWTLGLWEPDCCDIDVAALHAGYLALAKRLGVKLLCNAALQKAAYANGRWNIETAGGNYAAGMIVNAAGAWADNIAHIAGLAPLDIIPYRRTVLQIATDPLFSSRLPLVIGLDGSFYFKPENSGRIWLSPHDETASAPCDAAPDEYDIALAIDRFQQVVDCHSIKVERKWAGLRSFAPDRRHVIGMDPDCPDFFWFAGQGGFGIQTAPAAAQMAASLISEKAKAPANINAQIYAPDRFR